MTGAMLRLHTQDGMTLDVCQRCGGKGWVRAPLTFTIRTQNALGPFPTPSSGKPIPCPTCRGSKNNPVA